MPGKTIKLFYVDGEPNGLRIADVMLSSALALAIPRGLLAKFKNRPEASRPGVYILLGEDPDEPGGMKAYIGEAEELVTRLAHHAKDESKEWWTEAIAFTSKDGHLTKAHAKYLELALWQMAKQAQRVNLTNGGQPPGASLPESDQADMETFLELVRLVLPPLSARAWQMLEPGTGVAASGPVFTYRILEAEAQMRRTAEGYVVLKGSTAVKRMTSSMGKGYRAQRDALARDGILVPHSSDDLWLFAADAIFSSASAAASMITGSAQNGLRVWKLPDGRTLGEIEAEELA